jgi:hypothetical protein
MLLAMGKKKSVYHYLKPGDIITWPKHNPRMLRLVIGVKADDTTESSLAMQCQFDKAHPIDLEGFTQGASFLTATNDKQRPIKT